MAWGDCGSDEDDEAVGRSAASDGRGRRRSIAAEKQWGEIDAAAAAEAGSCRLSPTGSSSSSSIEVIEEHSGGNSRPSLKSDAGGKRPSKSVPSFTRDGRMRHGGHNGYAKSGFSPDKPPPKRIAAAGGGSSGQVAAGTARRLRAPASGPLRSTSSGAGRAGSISVAARLPSAPSAQTSVHASSGLQDYDCTNTPGIRQLWTLDE
ncbi:hypothetical protein THAOC_25715 [Thalassiosira oceanica]|uniref:Uncharacterized protein n=1 Tax=Thalassiosira oceanica TaxID=159749 RepID=K0RQL7_THAOC|nr:hypothetical protein THAOC_25715 [Thalassiosira oceanica]|eukprot:EJK54639.1 hypothetical protein THAOC_25715 [Thalassiosira oceanica]